MIVLDSRYVEGSNLPVSRTTGDGDTYQTRKLSGGRVFEVLKNLPDRQRFTADLEPVAADVQWTELTYFWLATITLGSRDGQHRPLSPRTVL